MAMEESESERQGGDLFASCYELWVEDVAKAISTSKPQARFGLFGRWGSGKTAACHALIRKLTEHSNQKFNKVLRDSPGREREAVAPLRPFVGVRINALRIVRAGSDAPQELLRHVNRSLKEWRDVAKRDLEPRQVVGLLRLAFSAAQPLIPASAMSAAVHALAAPVGATALMSLLDTPAAKKALETLGQGMSKKALLAAKELEVDLEEKMDTMTKSLFELVLFVDDLDRCSSLEAARMLSITTDAFDEQPVRLVFAVDPEMIASHFAREFNVDHTAALEWALKYFDFAVSLPTARTDRHATTLKSAHNRMLRGHKEPNEEIDEPARYLIELAAREAIGFVPIREILLALPQASLWLRWSTASCTSPEEVKARLYLFLSILSQVVPEMFRVAARNAALLGQLPQLVGEAASGPPGEVGRGLSRNFGHRTMSVLIARPDLAQLGQHLLSRLRLEPQMLDEVVRVITQATSRPART